MKHKNEINEYSLVYCIFKKPVMRIGGDGFFHKGKKMRGILVKRVHNGTVWYHDPADYLICKSILD